MKKKIEKMVPVCNILKVNIAAVDIDWTLNYIKKNIDTLSGQYICVSNVHTTVSSYFNTNYCAIQNNAIMALPDGGPLSTIGRKRGFSDMERVTGPDLMDEIFKSSEENQYKHYFYGSTDNTLKKLRKSLIDKYPDINIVGMHSPPFRDLTSQEDDLAVKKINDCNPDFIWIGLGAPKQEKWMSDHREKVNGLMLGVGAGFDYFAGNIKRAPHWMQKNNLEWFYRLVQDPKRLFKRYLKTNIIFLILIARGK